MGKIRIKSFDETTPEELAKQKAKKEAKRAEKIAQKNEQKASVGKKTNPQTDGTIKAEKETVEQPIAKDAIEAVEEASEELSTTEAKNEIVTPAEAAAAPEEPKKEKKQKKEKFVTVKVDSKRHTENKTYVSKTQSYKIDQALEALRKFKKPKFDETVELHINVKDKATSGQVMLPHGTGKTLVIKVADDAIIAEVKKGKINFDILVATPSMMPQLAQVAKVLGPRGLMPNPKNGTITENTDEAIKKLSAGQITYKTEPISPILHVSVGKVSFEDNKLKDNISAFLSSVGNANIKSVVLKSTMSPSIRLSL